MLGNIEKLIEIIKNEVFTKEQKVEKVSAILDENPELINARISENVLRSVIPEYGYYRYNITLLHVAAVYNCTEIAQLLIDKGANINAISDDAFQDTPLHQAAFYGKREVAELLLKCGANIESKDYHSNTPLHRASDMGHDAVVKLLLEKNANANAVSDDPDHRKTSLHKAITNIHRGNNYLNIVKMLLDYGASTEIEDLNNGTPLHEAAASSEVEAIRLLLDAQANVNAKNEKGETPLHKAVASSEVEAIRLLLDAQANVNAKNERGETPLHIVVNYMALISHSKEILCDVAELLLNGGADINAKDKNGNIPLHNAAFHCSEGVTRLFLKNGAKINETNNCGLTPLERAVCGGSSLPWDLQPDRESTIRFLIEQTLGKYYLTKPDFLGNIKDLPHWKEREYPAYWDKCQAEVEKMQEHKIGNSGVSFFDILVANKKQLESYVKNDNIVKILDTYDYKGTFPVYADKIKSQYTKGMNEKVAADIILNLYKNVNEDTSHIIFKHLGYAEKRKLTIAGYQELVERKQGEKSKEEQNTNTEVATRRSMKHDDAISDHLSNVNVKKRDNDKSVVL